jgi:hypothetical protein
MDIDYIKKEEIIDRYLTKRLTLAELYSFENYYFQHPEILDRIEIKRKLNSNKKFQFKNIFNQIGFLRPL